MKVCILISFLEFPSISSPPEPIWSLLRNWLLAHRTQKEIFFGERLFKNKQLRQARMAVGRPRKSRQHIGFISIYPRVEALGIEKRQTARELKFFKLIRNILHYKRSL